MRLLFVGDTHGDRDLGKVAHFLAKAQLGRDDALIHCGDIGVAWSGEEDSALFFWRSLPMKVLVCLGNHENYPWVMRQPLVRRYGCYGWDLGGRVFAPLRGQTARLGGRLFWFYPGGFSIDYPFRTPGKTLHAQELILSGESDLLMLNALRKKRLDYVISHDGPFSWLKDNLGYPIKPPPDSYWDHLKQQRGSRAHPAFALEQLYRSPQPYKAWYFGHHHVDLEKGRLRCLFNLAVLEDLRTGERRVISSGG